MPSDKEIEARMSLTERERTILQLARQGLSDYKIARKINTDPPSVTRSRKNAQRKLRAAKTDLMWADKIGIPITLCWDFNHMLLQDSVDYVLMFSTILEMSLAYSAFLMVFTMRILTFGISSILKSWKERTKLKSSVSLSGNTRTNCEVFGEKLLMK